MSPRTCSKWTAYCLSLAVPGAGQLAAGSWWFVLWFIFAGFILAAVASVSANWHAPAAMALQVVALLLLGLCSAEHAKRLLERRTWTTSGESRAGVTACHVDHRSVNVRIEVETSLSRAEVWRRMADVETFLTIDPFHEAVTLARREGRRGVHVVLSHNVFNFRFRRYGRILWWRDGQGYAVSDLSARGSRVGFPHIFVFRLSDMAPGQGCRLTVDVRGKWTTPWVPMWLARWWLYSVCRDHARLLRQAI